VSSQFVRSTRSTHGWRPKERTPDPCSGTPSTFPIDPSPRRRARHARLTPVSAHGHESDAVNNPSNVGAPPHPPQASVSGAKYDFTIRRSTFHPARFEPRRPPELPERDLKSGGCRPRTPRCRSAAGPTPTRDLRLDVLARPDLLPLPRLLRLDVRDPAPAHVQPTVEQQHPVHQPDASITGLTTLSVLPCS